MKSPIMLKILAVAILFGFFAGWITVFGCLAELHGLNAAQSWEKRRGVITHSYARHVRGAGRGRYWDVQIAGTYVGTDQTFQAARTGYGFEMSVNTRAHADRLTARYPVGLELDVFQDPDHPRNAILVRDNSRAPTYYALGVGLFFGVLPFLLYVFGRLRNAFAQ